MVTKVNRRRLAGVALIMLAGALIVSSVTYAQPAPGVAAPAPTGKLAMTIGDGLRVGGLALGAGVAIAGTAMATGQVQAAVGAAGMGALAEKPDLLGLVLILIAIPETLVIFGFVAFIMLWIKI